MAVEAGERKLLLTCIERLLPPPTTLQRGPATAFVGLDIQLSKRKARGPYFSIYTIYLLSTYIHILSFRNTMLLRKQERKEGNERALSRYVPVLYVDLKSEKGTNVFFFFQVE